MMTPDNSEIVFDVKSGISEEEQREILAKIDSIAEKNRLSLSEGKKPRFKAKKSGGRFPVIVNIIALAALAGGLIILISVQGKTDARIRTGTRVYNSAERALIEEIRRETQNEAASELERLNEEQSQAAAVEAQMSGFFANLNRQITANNLNEAAGTLQTMRDFINTPAFGALRSVQARKELYAQAINSFEKMVEETRKYQAALNNGAGDWNSETAGLQVRIAQLEKDLAEKDKTIESISSQGSGTARRLTELEKSNSTLQAENTRLNRTNNTLQTRNSQLTADVNRLQQAERNLQTERAETARLNQVVTARDNTLANRNDVITRIRSEVELDRDYDDIPPAEIKTRIARIQNALRSLN